MGALLMRDVKKNAAKNYFPNLIPAEKSFRWALWMRLIKGIICWKRRPTCLLNYVCLNDPPDGIFLSHAHIGHYAGLMYLGKEAMNADSIPVYVMPRMKTYLETNGPWSQLVLLKNIKLLEAQANRQVVLSSSLSITPFIVPHRDEFSETVGFKVEGPGKTALFIPDIDKWAKWQNNVAEEIKKVDYAFMDATFFDAAEIQNRDISLIPHPFVVESMKMFEALPREEKNKIYFIHFNHTNPLLDPGSGATDRVLKAGFNVSVIGQVFHL